LGAAINFEAGTIRRAPAFWREVGLEWLWRIKEEPHLYKRYVRDAWGLARTILFQVLPLLVLSTIDRLQSDSRGLKIDARESPDQTELALAGAATAAFVPLATEYFRAAINCHKNVTINLAETCRLDARFLGLILMLNKILVEQGLALCVTSIPAPIARRLKLSGFGFLLQ
jgi:N-acetylglucosaminyldiphosphoundecaprenol N-acetyl-beta-D-mannosaminyltransferase